MNRQNRGEVEKKGWISRLLSAVGEKCLLWFFQTEWSLPSAEAYMFMHYCGFGSFDRDIEATMAESRARKQWDEEV